jgi:hypothetical protein
VRGIGQESVAVTDSRVRLRVGADYTAFPIWPESESARQLRIPEELPLSSGLVGDLWRWASVHDRARTDASNFKWNESVQRERDWIEQGRQLAALVQSELGEDFEVVYGYDVAP